MKKSLPRFIALCGVTARKKKIKNKKKSFAFKKEKTKRKRKKVYFFVYSFALLLPYNLINSRYFENADKLITEGELQISS